MQLITISQNKYSNLHTSFIKLRNILFELYNYYGAIYALTTYIFSAFLSIMFKVIPHSQEKTQNPQAIINGKNKL